MESLDLGAMSSESGAALFWFLRNSLFFDQEFNKRSDVLLVSYDRLTADPVGGFLAVDRFVGLDGEHPVSAEAIRLGSVPDLLNIDSEVRARCDEMQRRLDNAWELQRKRLEDSPDQTGGAT